MSLIPQSTSLLRQNLLKYKDLTVEVFMIPISSFQMWVYICRPIGDVAQLVEQWIENPCVGGSIPSITTRKPFGLPRGFFVNNSSQPSV